MSHIKISSIPMKGKSNFGLDMPIMRNIFSFIDAVFLWELVKL